VVFGEKENGFPLGRARPARDCPTCASVSLNERSIELDLLNR